MPGVERVRLDMCQYGMTSHWRHRGGELGPVMKPTGMLTNSPFLRLELSRRCPRDHEHVHLVGGRAAAAQEYPYEVCEALCQGAAAQKKSDMSHILYTLPMGGQGIASLSSLCQEATFVMSDKTNGWPGLIEKPIGSFTQHSTGGIHEPDGHALGYTLTSRDGEAALYHEMNALMGQNGI